MLRATRLLTLLVSVGLVTAITAPAAHAAPEPTLRAEARPAPDRWHQVRLDIGIASALGFGGLAYTFVPWKHFQLEAGVGAGFTGAQLSLMPKLTTGSDRHKFVVGVGASVGIGSQWLIHTESGVVPFVNIDVGYQAVARSGLTFNIAVGPTFALDGKVSCGWYGPRTCDARGSFQMRLGFGYSF